MVSSVDELRMKKDLTPEESARVDLDIRIDALTGQMLGQTYTNDYEFNKKLLGILMDAVDLRAHAEGVAEGAEQERERILVAAHFAVNLTGNGLGSWIVPYLVLKPASVLAPTGEGKK